MKSVVKMHIFAHTLFLGITLQKRGRITLLSEIIGKNRPIYIKKKGKDSYATSTNF